MTTPALLSLGAAALLFSGQPRDVEAEAPKAAPAPPVLQIQARELWVSADRRIEDGLLVISEGRVRSVGSAADVDQGLPLLRHDGVLTAGLVACRSQSGAAGELQDDTRAVLAEARAVHALDSSSRELRQALAAGITSLALTPGRRNLVGGLACVVKTADGRVLAAESALSISLTGATLGRSTSRRGGLFGAAEEGVAKEATGDLAARADGGPEVTGRSTRGSREPTSYVGALAMLEQLFSEGAGPFGRAARAELPVTIEAWDRHEVLRALHFARAHGLRGAIHGAPLAGAPEIIAALEGSQMGVVLGPYSAGQSAASLASLKLLAAAGVRVGFALDAPTHSPEELRLGAVRALRSGAPRAAAWKALTEDAAILAGVGESVGKLEPGFQADFVLWSGDPLDLSSRIVSVHVDGRAAWPLTRSR